MIQDKETMRQVQIFHHNGMAYLCRLSTLGFALGIQTYHDQPNHIFRIVLAHYETSSSLKFDRKKRFNVGTGKNLSEVDNHIPE
jgi:hypothetical protein